MNFYEWTLGKEYNAERTDGSDEVSLVCMDHSQDFDCCQPTISHIRWGSRPMIRHILKWVTNMSRGKADLRQTEAPAEFMPGETFGPPHSRYFRGPCKRNHSRCSGQLGGKDSMALTRPKSFLVLPPAAAGMVAWTSRNPSPRDCTS